MVARISSGKSIRGVLNYNENKVQQKQAKVLMASGFPRDADRLSFNNKLHCFEYLTKQNSRVSTNALHITLNFSRQDKIDDELLKRIAADYMQGIGFGDQPYLLYRHFDASHPHVHIATVNITEGGQRIETYNLGKNQSEKTRKEIENYYSLIRAEDQKKEVEYMLRPAILTQLVYGRAETKAAISSIVREVTGTYKYTSLAELNAILRQFNVWANPGSEGSVMREKNGLAYHLLNESGNPVGVPIKASSIYGNPTIKNLKTQYAINSTERKPYAQRLKHLLDKALASAAGLDELKQMLQKQGIRILFRENQEGQIYGITFIDNATRCVFNGSDLGKNYSVKMFQERLHQKEIIVSSSSRELSAPQTAVQIQQTDQKGFPAIALPVIEILLDICMYEGDVPYTPDSYRKKKKKKRLRSE